MAVDYAPFPCPGSGHLATKRLTLRPFRLADAEAVERLAGDFDVAKMLDRVPYPYPRDEAEAWIATHEDGRRRGSRYPFAVEAGAGLIGSVALDREPDGRLHLGYWIGKPWWGKGYATEAARAALAFAFDELGQGAVKSGHYADNHASGRVMTKLGFRYVREGFRFSKARGYAVRFLDTIVDRERFRR